MDIEDVFNQMIWGSTLNYRKIPNKNRLNCRNKVKK